MSAAARDKDQIHIDTVQTTPQNSPRLLSKLPIPHGVVTPNSAPSRPQWRSRVADRVAFTEKTAREGRGLRQTKQDSVTIQSHQSSASTPVHKAADKPLPPRPILQSINLQSPSRDSRVLIDASEQPLRMSSPSGAKRDWQSLKPNPASSITSNPPTHAGADMAQDDPMGATQTTTPASVMVETTEFTNVFTGNTNEPRSSVRRRSRCPGSPCESATESSTNDRQQFIAYGPDQYSTSRNFSTPENKSAIASHPKRNGSLRDRISGGSLIPQAPGSSRKFMTFTDYTRPETASSAPAESRPHGPSPASFPQPRPGSGQFVSPHGTLKEVRTASRIPITGKAKATIVDVPPSRASVNSSSSARSSSAQSRAPAFGNRRLDTKNVEVLDNGIKRRQLQRTCRDHSAAGSSIKRAPTNASDATTIDTPSGSEARGGDAWEQANLGVRILPNSEEDLPYAYTPSEDESEVVTPLDRPIHSPGFGRVKKSTAPTASARFSSVFDDEIISFPRPPPSTSPFMGPLQTIPSEAVLPTRDVKDDPEINQALSHLEGKGSPPRRDVDEGTFMDMFGHVQKAFDSRKTHNTSLLAEHAATAEKFLAMEHNSNSKLESHGTKSSTPLAFASSEYDVTNLIYGLEPAVSKWSDTSSSGKGDSDDLPQSMSQPAPHVPLSKPSQPSPSKDHAKSHVSIGYPSRAAATHRPLTSSLQSEVADVPDIARRQSSPTLGPKVPGSVRNAHEGIKASPAGFARTTQAAEARRNTRLPTPSARSGSDQRGRQPAALGRVTRRESEAPVKIPRARSKGRYVLDKINGLFSGKRDKKGSIMSPVPRVDETFPPNQNASAIPIEEYPTTPVIQICPRVPPVPRIPSSYRRIPSLQNTESKTTLRTDEETLADGPAMQTSNCSALQALAETLVDESRRERKVWRKDHLLNLAKVLSDTLIYTREAQVYSETAAQAARSAQMSFEMTQRALEALQNFAVRRLGRHCDQGDF